MPSRSTVRLAGEHIDAQLSAGMHTLLVGPDQRDTSALRAVLDAASAWYRMTEPGAVVLDGQTANEIKSALEDAADYRNDGGGPDACADCTTEQPCRDHEVDAAMASMYLMHRDTLDAATAGQNIPDLPAFLSRLRDVCDRAGWSYHIGLTYDTGYGLWDAEITIYHATDGASGPRTGQVVETGGSLSPTAAIVGAVKAALLMLDPPPEVIAPGAFRNLPADVPVRFGIGGPVVGTATVRADGTATARIAEGIPGWDALAGLSMSFRIPGGVTPAGEDKSHD